MQFLPKWIKKNEGTTSPLQNRQNIYPNDPVLPLGSIEIHDFKPSSTCLVELNTLKNLPGMDKLDIILDECVEWTESFVWKNHNPNGLDENEIFAVCIYTYDLLAKGKQEENFYFQLNNMLRMRSPQEFDKWRGYLYYLQNALHKFPNLITTVYRGIPMEHLEYIQKEYLEKRPIFWSGFSSSTPSLDVAKLFAKQNGIILKTKINQGKVIKEYSFLSGESEVLIRPNSNFIVTKALYKDSDGFYYVELEEMQKTLMF